MAVEASKVKARLRILFPKANLSTARLDAISDKLGKKIIDDATDAQIDESVNELNDIFSFEEIAKNDDRVRTDKSKSRSDEEPSKKGEDADDKTDDTPSWAKALIERLDKVESDKKAQTLTERFKKDERLKGVPDWMVDMAIPKDEDSFDEAADALNSKFNDFATKNKLENYGGDNPSGGTKKPASSVKEISKDDASSIIDGM